MCSPNPLTKKNQAQLAHSKHLQKTKKNLLAASGTVTPQLLSTVLKPPACRQLGLYPQPPFMIHLKQVSRVCGPLMKMYKGREVPAFCFQKKLPKVQPNLSDLLTAPVASIDTLTTTLIYPLQMRERYLVSLWNKQSQMMRTSVNACLLQTVVAWFVWRRTRWVFWGNVSDKTWSFQSLHHQRVQWKSVQSNPWLTHQTSTPEALVWTH